MNRQHRATDGWAKNKNSLCKVASWLGVFLVIATLGTGDARAQTV